MPSGRFDKEATRAGSSLPACAICASTRLRRASARSGLSTGLYAAVPLSIATSVALCSTSSLSALLSKYVRAAISMPNALYRKGTVFRYTSRISRLEYTASIFSAVIASLTLRVIVAARPMSSG